jgi:hypothetical protein
VLRPTAAQARGCVCLHACLPARLSARPPARQRERIFCVYARGNSAGVLVVYGDSINTRAFSDNGVELRVFHCSRKEHIPTETR